VDVDPKGELRKVQNGVYGTPRGACQLLRTNSETLDVGDT
jgi:hypothetical protein